MPTSYLARKTVSTLAETNGGAVDEIVDTLFINERFDDGHLAGRVFKHCTFANVSFLRATLESCTFLDCVFLDCYFRLTTISSKFPASRFVSCDFARSTLADNADFNDYTYWQDCYIKFDEINSRLPSRLNLRVRLANNLATECELAGESAEARKFRLLAISAREQHCRKIYQNKESSYQKKYANQRLDGLWEYLKSKFQGLIWGYGERARIPISLFVILTFLLYPLAYWALNGSFDLRPGQSMTYWSYLLVSLDNVLPVAGVAPVLPNSDFLRFVIASQVLCGVLYAGIFIALLLKVGQRR